MKLQCNLIECANGRLVFEYVGLTPQLEKKGYNLNLTELKSQRTLQSNSYMWALIQAIADKTDNSPMDIYIRGLEHANAKCEWLAGLPEIENELLKVFRAVKPYGTVTTENNKQLVRYKCYIGSSKFDKEEMNKLISYFQDLAVTIGVNIEQ